MINVTGLSIKQGERLLFRNISFHLLAGQSICICGGSGSGKSSLLKALVGFTPIASGTILIDGTALDKSQIDEVRRRIAWLPQELALPSEWVSEMVRLPFELKANRSVVFDEKKILALFHELGLPNELYRKRVSEISGGERQRIMLAVTVLLQKKIIVVDEPTSALDMQSTALVIKLFQRLCREDGVAIVAVSHDVNFAASCSQVLQL